MSTTLQETCVSVQSVTDVLTRLGDALASGDLDGMLAAEPLLADLTHALQRASATPVDRAALLPHLTEARLALLRASAVASPNSSTPPITHRDWRSSTTAPARPASGSRPAR